MSQKISKRLIAMALCFAFCVQMVAGLSFAKDKDTTSYKVKVSVIDPEGNKLDMSKVDFMFQMGDSERYGAYSANASEGGRFIKWTPFVKWTNEYVSTEHERKGDFKYSISADMDDYMSHLTR